MEKMTKKEIIEWLNDLAERARTAYIKSGDDLGPERQRPHHGGHRHHRPALTSRAARRSRAKPVGRLRAPSTATFACWRSFATW